MTSERGIILVVQRAVRGVVRAGREAGRRLHLVRLVLFVDVQALAGRDAVVVRDVHVVRDELAAVARRGDGRRVLVQEVDLLERQALGLQWVVSNCYV